MATTGVRPPPPRQVPPPPGDPPPYRRRPLAARCALLSFLWPGLGQVLAGARRLGITLVVVTGIAVGAALTALLSQGRDDLIGEAVDTRVLTGLLAVNGAFALWRVGAIVDAARRGQRVRGSTATVAVLVALALVPHVAAGWYAYTAYSTVTDVFTDAEPSDNVAIEPDAFDLASTPTVPTVTADPGSVSAVGRTPQLATPPPATKPKALTPWQKRGRLNILLLGADAGPGRAGLRTDTMIVATIDLKSRRAALFSVPRNMGGVPFPPRVQRQAGARFPGLLNALHLFASTHPSIFPGGKDPGATALKQTLGQLTGLPIDYYLMVDFRGFHGLVDALGGVTLDVPHPVLDRVSPYEPGGQWIRIDLAAGRQHLTADQAFAYVRARSQTSDWARIKRQRCVIAALGDEVGPTTLLRSFRGLAKTFRDNITTDIPAKQLPALAKLATSVHQSQVISIGFVPPRFTSGATATGAAMPDVPAIRAAVRDALHGKAPKNDPTTIGGGACA
jgi:LCP family protein required for cell wall assembly